MQRKEEGDESRGEEREGERKRDDTVSEGSMRYEREDNGFWGRKESKKGGKMNKHGETRWGVSR